METPDSSPSSEVFQPTPEQIRRDDTLRRFNRRVVYTPIALAAILAFSIVLTMVLYVLLADTTEYLVTLSAIADSVIILMVFSSLVLIGSLLIIVGAVYFQARKQGIAPLRQTQRFLWRLDLLAIRIQRSVSDFVPKLANPFINIRARFAYWRVLVNKLKKLFSRE
jgi:ABC-type transport system involved in cytochrome c biogenesis permease subunit